MKNRGWRNMIPKIIHYCWLSDEPIPEDLQKYVDGWRKKLPEYKFIKWDFSRFDIDSSVWVKEAFELKKYAFACDYIRIYAVYNYGGIYMDMDVEVLKKFDDLLESLTMFAYERPDRTWIEAGCFGAEKHNILLKKCLERYEGRHFVRQDKTLDMLPLPRVIDEVVRNNNITINAYPWTYFTAKSYDTGKESPTAETYTIHHFAGSWKSNSEKNIHITAIKLKKIPIIGKISSFLYENAAKVIMILREQGVAELISRIKAYIKK